MAAGYEMEEAQQAGKKNVHSSSNAGSRAATSAMSINDEAAMPGHSKEEGNGGERDGIDEMKVYEDDNVTEIALSECPSPPHSPSYLANGKLHRCSILFC